MRLWIRYLREKRLVLALYVLTVGLLVAVGSLYHIENLGKLCYAAALTAAVWAVVGILDGMRYVQRSRQLEAVFRHYEQSGEVFLGDAGKKLELLTGSIERAESYEEAQAYFLMTMNERHGKELLRWEEKAAERGDYYLMWTHQIKTPIAAMKLLLERLELSDRDSFLMKEECFKIEQYVEMVLAFQRLESISDDMVLQPYGLYSLVRQAVKKYSLLFINKGLKLELGELDFRIVTDEKWFVFCLEQLLSNSIKYTPKGGISFRAEAEPETAEILQAGPKTGKRVLLLLEDTGIGIRAEDLPRIFERGFTGYNGRLDKRSTGIGLYLCRRVYEKLGITVQVESEDGKGTKVTLGIPWADVGEGCGE
ncbi:MAG TPA: hypothetical protein DCZ91_15365 [Lachnospiraceae bacterium]|nr:hypothetical protein [Lachnospiraceae bacterium]